MRVGRLEDALTSTFSSSYYTSMMNAHTENGNPSSSPVRSLNDVGCAIVDRGLP